MMLLCLGVGLFNILLLGGLVWMISGGHLLEYKRLRKLSRKGIRARARITGLVFKGTPQHSDPELLDDILLESNVDNIATAEGEWLVKCAYAALDADNQPLSLENDARVNPSQYLIWSPLLKVGQEVDIHYLKDEPEVFSLAMYEKAEQGAEMSGLMVGLPLLWGLVSFVVLLSGSFPFEVGDFGDVAALLFKHFIVLFFMAFMGIMLYANVTSAKDFIQKIRLRLRGLETEGRITHKWTVRNGKHTHYHIEYTYPEIEPFKKNISVTLKFYKKIGNGKVRVHYKKGDPIQSDIIGNPQRSYHFLLFSVINLIAVFVLGGLFYSMFEEAFGW